MTDTELKEEVIKQLKQIAPDTEPADLNPDDNIREVLGIDSFDYLSFIVKLDELFGVNTPEEDYGEIETMEKLIAYLQKKVKATQKV